MARPKRKFSEDELKILEKLAGLGMTKTNMAAFFSMDRSWFLKLIDKNKIIKTAIERGRSKAIAKVSESLYNKAIQGDTSCMIFFLKTQAGWTETPEEINQEETYKAPLSLVRQA